MFIIIKFSNEWALNNMCVLIQDDLNYLKYLVNNCNKKLISNPDYIICTLYLFAHMGNT